MIQVIAGKKGSGKTKRLIDLTNATARDAVHDVIFLDDDNRYMFDVDHKVRFINAEDYHIRSTDMFIGFLCGILSSNFDVGTIFIDAFLKLCHAELADTEQVVKIPVGKRRAESSAVKYDVFPHRDPDRMLFGDRLPISIEIHFSSGIGIDPQGVYFSLCRNIAEGDEEHFSAARKLEAGIGVIVADILDGPDAE